MKDKLQAIWKIITCRRFYVVTDQGEEGYLDRHYWEITIQNCQAIQGDARELADNAIEANRAVGEAQKIINNML